MRIAAVLALVVAMGAADIERAQQVARSRDSERAQFHRRYVFELTGDTVTQLEVVTEFRRLVLATEEHLRIGDQMFSRGTRLAEAALAPTRGLITFKSKLRFHPQNAYVDLPAFKLALGPAAPPDKAPLAAIDTRMKGDYSLPFKDRNGKNVTTLVGAFLETDLPATSVGQSVRALGVVLGGRELARISVDFGHLD